MKDINACKEAGANRTHWTIVFVCFLAVLLDGLDTAALSFAIPTLSREWGLKPSSFTAPLVLTNVGVVVGYLSAGLLGARFKGRSLLVAGVTFFAVFTILTALALPSESMATLAILRFVTGTGLGLVLPAAVSLATAHSPTHRRELVSVAVTLGLASGLTTGGLLGGQLIRSVGITGVFRVAGLLPLALAAAMLWILPATAPEVGTSATSKHEAKVGRLFDNGLRMSTSLIWAFSFLVFISAYTLISWVPTLLIGYGFAPTEAPLGLAYVSLGGVVGGLILMPLAARLGIARSLVLMATFGMIFIAIAAKASLSPSLLLLALGGAGLGITASQIGQLTLAVAVYPVGTRTTGVGWAAALGRLGSIVGPAIAGLLLALSLSAQNIIFMLSVPLMLAVACALALWQRERASSTRPAEHDPS